MSLSYAQSLRAIGESLEQFEISSIDLKKRDEIYTLRMSAKLPEKAKHQPPSPSPSGGGFFKKIVEKLGRPASQEELCNPPPSDEIRCYTSADIYRLIAEQRAKHGLANVMPNIYSISQILRVAGDWLDRKKINAFDVSFYGQTLCIGYESAVGEEIRESLDIRNLYDLAIQMYLRRTKR